MDQTIDEIKETGGARIGKMRMSWPLANIKVNEFRLEINASFAGTFVFRPCDISSIEPCGGGSLFTSGIRINHTVSQYKTTIIFDSLNQTDLIKKIYKTGFLNNKAILPYNIEEEINNIQTLGAFPFKKYAIIIIVGIWNLLFLYDFWEFYQNGEKGFPLGIGAEIALGFMLSICILLLTIKPFSGVILKDDRDIHSIKTSIYSILIISFILLLSLAAFPKIAIK